MNNTKRLRIIISGQVQGVGFRPFIYRLAGEYGLSGLTGNNDAGVIIEAQGKQQHLDDFCKRIRSELPPLAAITAMSIADIPAVSNVQPGFFIIASTGSGGSEVLISPDVATCADCMADMSAPEGRRLLYPFTNCTNCGPRFTITKSVPYDRATTSMACFTMCSECRAEYDNPLDRRFHAQPNACPVCGPGLFFADAGGCPKDEATPPDFTDKDALLKAALALAEGKILAMKGLGGFHLVCDAFAEKAVTTLRLRKNRPHKPLAVMVANFAEARRIAMVSHDAECLLNSRQRPIVLCPKIEPDAPEQSAPGTQPDKKRPLDAVIGQKHYLETAPGKLLPHAIAPDAHMIGLMLPYTPLHYALLEVLAQKSTSPVALVMTSGNAGGDPICLGNREALNSLKHIADAFLLHNRDILTRVDDSVIMPESACGPQIFYRRARGYVPTPICLSSSAPKTPTVLGVGAELKATLCVNRGSNAFVSQHIGDLQNAAVYDFYRDTAQYLPALLRVSPEMCVCDLHPDYLSTRYAEETKLPLTRLQHHFAHAFSVLGENEEAVVKSNGRGRPALIITLDGTGLGDDHTIWGGELLLVNLLTMEKRRLGRLSLFGLPGGEAAVREPWRIAQGLLVQTANTQITFPWTQQYAPMIPLIGQMVERGLNCPQTSSCGRLFDAVAALLGLCFEISYEGQAAIMLENTARGKCSCQDAPLPYQAKLSQGNGLWELSSEDLFLAALADLRQNTPLPLIARRFHLGLAAGFTRMAAQCAKEYGAELVGLSGGVMQNQTLFGMLNQQLQQAGLIPLTHKVLPPNDACISFGQTFYGIRLNN